MTKSKDLYTRLGVARDADTIVISAAYRALAKRHHPDSSDDTPEAATEQFRSINQAYSVLSNPELRREYDIGLSPVTSTERQDGPSGAQTGHTPKNYPERVQRGAALLLLIVLAAAAPLLLLVLAAVVAANFGR